MTETDKKNIRYSAIKDITNNYINNTEIKTHVTALINILQKQDPERFKVLHEGALADLTGMYSCSSIMDSTDRFYKRLIAVSIFSKKQGGFAQAKKYEHVENSERLTILKEKYRNTMTDILRNIMKNQMINLNIEILANKNKHKTNVISAPRTNNHYHGRSRHQTIPITISITLASIRNVFRFFPEGYFSYRNKLRPVLQVETTDDIGILKVIFIQIETYEKMHIVQGFIKHIPRFDAWVFSARLVNLAASENRYIAREVAKSLEVDV